MTDQAMSPLRRRMIEDMTIRKLAPKTQQGYIRAIKDFAAFLGRSPDTASFEDVRRFQLHLTANGAHIPIVNHTLAALRFFFRITLRRSDIIEHTTFIHEPRKLPVVLSPEGNNISHRSTLCANYPREMAISFLRCFGAARKLVSGIMARVARGRDIPTRHDRKVARLRGARLPKLLNCQSHFHKHQLVPRLRNLAVGVLPGHASFSPLQKRDGRARRLPLPQTPVHWLAPMRVDGRGNNAHYAKHGHVANELLKMRV
jgi:hypothetical protein